VLKRQTIFLILASAAIMLAVFLISGYDLFHSRKARDMALYFGVVLTSLTINMFLEKSIRRHHWLAFLSSLAFVAAIILIYPRFLSTDDDAGILFDIQAGYLPPFISSLLGRSLSALYLHVGSEIPWYGIGLYLGDALALAVFIYGICVIDDEEQGKWIILEGVLFAFAALLMTPSYNSSSLMCGIAALFVTIVYIRRGEATSGRILSLGALFALAFLFRKSSVVAIMAFGAVAVLIVVFRALPSRWSGFRPLLSAAKPWLIFILPFILCFAANLAVEKIDLRDPAEAKYQAFNKLRGGIHSYPIANLNRDNKKLLEANGWTKNDYDLFCNYFFIDDSKYTTDTVKNVYKYSKSVVKARLLSSSAIKDALKGLLHLVPCFVFILIGLFYSIRLGGGKLQGVAICGSALAIAFAMLLFARLPDYIALPVLFETALLPIAVVGPAAPPRRRRLGSREAILLLLLFLFPFATFSFNKIETVRKDAAMRKTNLNRCIEAMEILPASAFIYFRPGMFLTSMDPLKTYHFQEKLIPTGWTTFTPRFYDIIKKRLGLNSGHEVLSSLATRDDIYILSDVKWFPKKLEKYLKENFNNTRPIISIGHVGTMEMYVLGLE
jgi:hypothetical protein